MILQIWTVTTYIKYYEVKLLYESDIHVPYDREGPQVPVSTYRKIMGAGWLWYESGY